MGDPLAGGPEGAGVTARVVPAEVQPAPVRVVVGGAHYAPGGGIHHLLYGGGLAPAVVGGHSPTFPAQAVAFLDGVTPVGVVLCRIRVTTECPGGGDLCPDAVAEGVAVVAGGMRRYPDRGARHHRPRTSVLSSPFLWSRVLK